MRELLLAKSGNNPRAENLFCIIELFICSINRNSNSLVGKIWTLRIPILGSCAIVSDMRDQKGLYLAKGQGKYSWPN